MANLEQRNFALVEEIDTWEGKCQELVTQYQQVQAQNESLQVNFLLLFIVLFFFWYTTQNNNMLTRGYPWTND